jgi:hypothetical protein
MLVIDMIDVYVGLNGEWFHSELKPFVFNKHGHLSWLSGLDCMTLFHQLDIEVSR